MSQQSVFEQAAVAVVDGQVQVLQALLTSNPELARMHSKDSYGATLMHYVAANGVPDELQRTPPNAVEVCNSLLNAGADPDALCSAYGGGPKQTPLALLVSSWHPYERGVQNDLVRAMVAGGARADGIDNDGIPLSTALVFGYTEAAETLVEVGARVDNLLFASGLGNLSLVEGFFHEDGALRAGALGSYSPAIAKQVTGASQALVQEAFHFAVTNGRQNVCEFLLTKGADPNGRTTGQHCELPLLQAAFVRECKVAGWLLSVGADPDEKCSKRGMSAREHIRANGPPELADLLES